MSSAILALVWGSDHSHSGLWLLCSWSGQSFCPCLLFPLPPPPMVYNTHKRRQDLEARLQILLWDFRKHHLLGLDLLFPGSSSGCCSPVTQVPESTTVSPASLPSLPNKSWAVPAPPASRQTLLPPAGQLPWFPDTRNRTYPGWEERKEWCQSLPVPGEGLSRCKKGHSCPRAESFLRA